MKNQKQTLPTEMSKEILEIQEKDKKFIQEEVHKEVHSAEQELEVKMKKGFEQLSKEVEDLNMSNIIALLEKHDDKAVFAHIEKSLMNRLKSLSSGAFEDRGVTYYYLLRNFLNKNTQTNEKKFVELFPKLIENFEKYINKTLKELNNGKKTKNYAFKEVQLMAFLKITETYFLNLEDEFKKKNFLDFATESYKKRMHYRTLLMFLQKNYVAWAGYKIWGITSQYGQSFIRWGITTLIFILIFSSVFWLMGEAEFVPIDHAGNMILSDNPTGISSYVNHPMLYKVSGHWYDYIYFSIVTFTTLGYGDILPVTVFDKIAMILLVFTGYIMLGVFMSLLSKKF